MQATIQPGKISGSIKAPASKSMMQRTCAAALLHKGKTVINNPGTSADDEAALRVVEQLGATVTRKDSSVTIESGGVAPKSNVIDCGESGLCARMFAPIAALSDKAIQISGSGSLLSRNMDGFSELFAATGIEIKDFSGTLPISVQGPLQVKNIKINGAASSQYLSGLLFAYAFNAKEEVQIKVEGLNSKPYIDMSLQVLEHLGKCLRNEDYTTFYIGAAKDKKEDIEITIEGDWSSAAMMLVAGAIAGDVSVSGLDINSRQADKAIIEVLKIAGAKVVISGDSVSVRQSELRAFEYDATDSPDLFPILAVLAACCDGDSAIKGVHRLWHKESNRAESIAEMLMQLEVQFSIEDDSLCITGMDRLSRGMIEGYNDHRIVMAASVAALRADGRIIVDCADAVKKSYPSFFEDLSALGVNNILNEA